MKDGEGPKWEPWDTWLRHYDEQRISEPKGYDGR